MKHFRWNDFTASFSFEVIDLFNPILYGAGGTVHLGGGENISIKKKIFFPPKKAKGGGRKEKGYV